MPAQAPPSEWELTSDEMKLIQKRAQLRATTKAEFLKRYRNPFYQTVLGHFVCFLASFHGVIVCISSLFLQVDPQNVRLYAYQQNTYRYLYTSPRILLAPALFVLAGTIVQYFVQKHRVCLKTNVCISV